MSFKLLNLIKVYTSANLYHTDRITFNPSVLDLYVFIFIKVFLNVQCISK